VSKHQIEYTLYHVFLSKLMTKVLLQMFVF